MSGLLNFPIYPLLLTFLGFSLYYPSLPGEFYFDDGFILQNESIVDLKNLPLFFQGGQTISPMRGVSMTTFAIQYHLFGWNAGIFRVFNILIHILNGCLVWLLVLNLQDRTQKLSGIPEDFNKKRFDKIAAAFAGALFIAHPVLTSGVAYIFQRNGLLCSFFYMCGFYGLLKAFPVNRPPNQKWIVFAGGTSILSIWSKETGITFIVITLVFHFLLRPKDTRCDWQRWFYPLGGICMLSLVIVFWQMVRTPIMKRTIYGDWTVWQNIITQWNVITEYLSLILWPHPAKLNIDHDFPISLSIMDQNTWLSGVILITLLGYGFWLTERNRLMALGVFWFFITLAVESSVIPISEVMVEYRLYLSMFGFILFIISGLKAVSEKMGFQKIFYASAVTLLTLFSVFTFQRNIVMREGFLVWQDAAEKSPNSIRAQTAYAAFLNKQGKYKEAIATYRKAALLNEKRLPFKLPMPQPHNELGVFLLERGDLEKARQQFIAALRIDRWFASSLENLKMVLEKFDSTVYEKAYLKTFIKVNYFPEGHYNLGNFYMRNKNYAKAIDQYRIAILQKPDFHEAYNNIATSYIQVGKKGKARLLFERALEINPDFKLAHDNLNALKLDEQ